MCTKWYVIFLHREVYLLDVGCGRDGSAPPGNGTSHMIFHHSCGWTTHPRLGSDSNPLPSDCMPRLLPLLHRYPPLCAGKSAQIPVRALFTIFKFPQSYGWSYLLNSEIASTVVEAFHFSNRIVSLFQPDCVHCHSSSFWVHSVQTSQSCIVHLGSLPNQCLYSVV